MDILPYDVVARAAFYLRRVRVSPRDQLASLWGRAFARVALRLLRAGLEMCLALPRNE